MKRNASFLLVVVAGSCLAIQSVSAQPTVQVPALPAGNVVNLGGATLMQNFITKRAAYNDYIDVNHDGISGALGTGIVDMAPPGSTSDFWVFSYRATGSGSGLKELVNYGVNFDTTAVTGDNIGLLGYFGGVAELSSTSSVATDAYTNRVASVLVGVPQASYQLSNPGGNPNRSDTSTLAVIPGPGSTGGIRVDIGLLDVPSIWFVRQAGITSPTTLPNTSGYGSNDIVALDKNGNPAVGGSNQLATLPAGFSIYDAGLGTSNDKTLFDSPVVWAPISPYINYGVGRTQAKMTDLRHLFVTGRMPSGENLVAVTRDSGSGTRNGFMTSMGMDPSFGRGDNLGGKTADNATNILGPNFQPSNKDGSSLMDATIHNHRLAIGYTGAERGVSGGWIGDRAEALDVLNDIYPGATTYVRPTLTNLLHNNVNGFLYGGPETAVTIGDPAAEPIANGGANNGHNKMRSEAAALWVNNLLRSIENASSFPADINNVGMPGELAASLFIPYSALDNVKNLGDPKVLDPNPAFNASLQSYLITSAASVFKDSRYAAFNTAGIGRSARTTGFTYSDGVAGGANYLKQDGNPQSYGSTLPLRDKISGDFNGDGLRNRNDISDLVKAYNQRQGGSPWIAPNGTGSIAGAPGTDAIIEVLGDFDGDGNFNTLDARYFADGLALDPASGNLDRFMGFVTMDNAQGCNFFNTIVGPGAQGINHYAPGASAADLTGASGKLPASGWAPIAADGRVDAKDIDYITAQFKRNSRITDGAANWNNLTEAAFFDLSADINGDLVVDQADEDLVVKQFLNTNYGDANLDGIVDAGDIATITANIGTAPATWARGDVDGNGVINSADLALANTNLGAGRPSCPADLDNGSGLGIADGGIDINDLLYFLAKFEAGSSCVDLDNGSGAGFPDGGVDINDLLFFLTHFEAGC